MKSKDFFEEIVQTADEEDSKNKGASDGIDRAAGEDAHGDVADNVDGLYEWFEDAAGADDQVDLTVDEAVVDIDRGSGARPGGLTVAEALAVHNSDTCPICNRLCCPPEYRTFGWPMDATKIERLVHDLARRVDQAGGTSEIRHEQVAPFAK